MPGVEVLMRRRAHAHTSVAAHLVAAAEVVAHLHLVGRVLLIEIVNLTVVGRVVVVAVVVGSGTVTVGLPVQVVSVLLVAQQVRAARRHGRRGRGHAGRVAALRRDAASVSVARLRLWRFFFQIFCRRRHGGGRSGYVHYGSDGSCYRLHWYRGRFG